MARVFLAGGVGLVLCVALAAAPVPPEKVTYLDLQPKANQKLKDNLGSGREGNDLTAVPQGEQKFEGVPFKVGEGLIQLGSKVLTEHPEKVEGIPVGQVFAKLHILHATGYGGGPNQEGSELFVSDDTVIGKYVVHYEDKTTEEIEVVYGKDVRDWWYLPEEKDVSRGKVAWKGENALAKQFGAGIRLYLTTWKNPKPAKKVVSLDYVSTKTTAAAPFCVAVTVEKE
jgi:hypothetical protein